MQFYLMENQETIVEANLKVSNTSSKIIGQYIVEGWRIEDFYDVESNITMKRVIVSLIRSQSVTIFVTHLPTFLMNFINQLTMFLIGESKYDLTITVNITSMMVLAGIYAGNLNDKNCFRKYAN